MGVARARGSYLPVPPRPWGLVRGESEGTAVYGTQSGRRAFQSGASEFEF